MHTGSPSSTTAVDCPPSPPARTPRRRGIGRRRGLGAVLAAVTLLTGGLTLGAPTAQAADLSGFDAGFIISDPVFYHSGSMTVDQIQAFLNDKGANCVPAADGTPCLKDLVVDTVTRIDANSYCAPYEGALGESAAQVIKRVADACGISPRTILVTLQKEQGLVTLGSGSATRLRKAMGYGCPDTAACDEQYFGFFNQVYSAARQFQRYAALSTQYNYKPGRVNTIQYKPNSTCGTAEVFIQNQATASLYNYTPYLPNAAALAAGYGLGDSCSSYGNRNFWNYFTDWFGSTIGGPPIGNLESISPVPGGFEVRGWSLDFDTTGTVYVWISYPGGGQYVLANSLREDVGRSYPTFGDNHGFVGTVTAPAGTYTVCATAQNIGTGDSNTTLGCGQVTVLGGAPTGQVDSVTGVAGGIDVKGWALDFDTTDSIYVWLSVDGQGSPVLANGDRLDVGQAYRGYGDAHGYSTTVPATPGSHQVCVTAVNVGSGSDARLTCTTVEVPAS